MWSKIYFNILFLIRLIIYILNYYRNFGLLSFGAEAEEDENETTEFIQKTVPKGKSTHDVLDDPKLSRDTLKADNSNRGSKSPDYIELLDAKNDEDDLETLESRAEKIRNKLLSKKRKISEEAKSSSDSDDDYLNDIEKEKKLKKQQKV